MIRRGDSRHPILVKCFLDLPLEDLIELHKGDVGGVDEEEDEGFRPMDVTIVEEGDERQESDGVEGAITEQRPPSQVENRLGKQSTHPNHEQNIKNSTSYTTEANNREKWDQSQSDMNWGPWTIIYAVA